MKQFLLDSCSICFLILLEITIPTNFIDAGLTQRITRTVLTLGNVNNNNISSITYTAYVIIYFLSFINSFETILWTHYVVQIAWKLKSRVITALASNKTIPIWSKQKHAHHPNPCKLIGCLQRDLSHIKEVADNIIGSTQPLTIVWRATAELQLYTRLVPPSSSVEK